MLGQDYEAFGVWKSIFFVTDDSDRYIRYRVHDGQRIRFFG